MFDFRFSRNKLKSSLCFLSFIFILGMSNNELNRNAYSLIYRHSIDKNNTIRFIRSNNQNLKGFVLNFGNKSIHYNKLYWKTPSSFNVVYASDATISFPSGFVFNKSHSFDFGKWYWSKGNKLMNENLVRHNGVVFTFIQIWNNFFQHIVFDTLPKAHLACNWLQIHKTVEILVYNKLQMELIQAVCILSKSRFIMLTSGMQFNGIYLSYFGDSTYKMGIIPPACLQSLGSQAQSGSDVIYLPRKEGKSRSVSNEREVLILLKRYWPDLKIAKLTNNWKQDKTYFSSAGIIIGPHGGAMSNMIFSPINTTVVEFLPIEQLSAARKNERPCYLGLAKGLGFSYFAVEPERFSFDGYIKVSLRRLEHVVKVHLMTRQYR